MDGCVSCFPFSMLNQRRMMLIIKNVQSVSDNIYDLLYTLKAFVNNLPKICDVSYLVLWSKT